MYAIIATGGKQYKVSEGDVIDVEKIAASMLRRSQQRQARKLLSTTCWQSAVRPSRSQAMSQAQA